MRKYIVKWTKRFVSGNLVGLTHESELDFANEIDALRYVAFLKEHSFIPVDTVSSSGYTCHNPKIINRS